MLLKVNFFPRNFPAFWLYLRIYISPEVIMQHQSMATVTLQVKPFFHAIFPRFGFIYEFTFHPTL